MHSQLLVSQGLKVRVRQEVKGHTITGLEMSTGLYGSIHNITKPLGYLGDGRFQHVEENWELFKVSSFASQFFNIC